MLLITELYTILETPPPVVESGPHIRYQMVTCWLDSGWTQACGSWPRSRRWLRTSREIEAAFATLLRDRADALFGHVIPATYSSREYVEAGRAHELRNRRC